MRLTKISDDRCVVDFDPDQLEIYSKLKLFWITLIRRFNNRSVKEVYLPLFLSIVDDVFYNCSKNVKSNLQFKPLIAQLWH